MVFKRGAIVQCLLVLSVVVALRAVTVTDSRGQQFEQREIVVPTGLSEAELNVEIQKAIRELYPDYRDKQDFEVKELSSLADLNKKATEKSSEKKATKPETKTSA